MNESCRDVAAKKIAEMPAERVSKLLIFMAGMEAEEAVKEKIYSAGNQPYNPPAFRSSA